MNLVLVGFKNCGKSHFGKLLAQELQLNFVDSDQVILELTKAPSCKDLHARVGEESFREIEKQALLSLQNSSHSIIAAGGGAIVHEEVATLGKLIYLEAPLSLLKERGLPQWLEEQFEKRKSLYEKKASYRISIQGKSDRQILNELKETYGK